MCAYLVCVLNVLYTVSVLILHRESFSSSAITPCHVLISQTSRTRDEDLTAICHRTKKKRSQNFNSVVSFGKPEWKKVIASSLETTEYATVTYKKYLYRFRINQITFTYGEMKNERPVSYGMFSQNLSISTPSTATLPQRSAIGVRTQPVLPLGTRVTWQCARFQPIKRCVIFFMLIITVEITWLPRQSTSRWSISLYDQALRRRHGNRKSEEVDDEVDVSCGSKSFCNVYGRATWLIPWLERSSAKLQGKTEIHIDRNLVSKIAETDYHWVSDILFRIKRVPQVR